ncbi:hypothetical protein L323_02275 [Ruminiclostridium papyrosolvens C7]|uniref:Uncharacterized protein n=1 Tax=Ruminiclostridium papyrosolvens C7 TaxID=1330534 RepID=U4R742_9FIRM|nr:hypothetical protein L323_02275 [Ruminiclostridium papyrosolvens C7]
MGYCGSCVQFEEDQTGKCKCRKFDMPCKAGQKACMYFTSNNTNLVRR